jgi:hypothetical protein
MMFKTKAAAQRALRSSIYGAKGSTLRKCYKVTRFYSTTKNKHFYTITFHSNLARA